MILEIDIGNTRLKWRLVSGGGDTCLSGWANSPSRSGDSPLDYDGVFARVEACPEAILVASVVPGAESRLSQWCRTRWGLSPKFARVERHCAGVTNGYDELAQMGVDRWLAMVAVYQHSPRSCLVVDAGSALTVDLLSSDGQHLGGYIVPGLQSMRGALVRDTGSVRTTAIDYDGVLAPGTSTRLAVSSGLQCMHVGLVLKALDDLLSHNVQTRADQAPLLCLTGGGARSLSGVLQNAFGSACESIFGRGHQPARIPHMRLISTLVLDGLGPALRERA